jgi:hypothetical protein
MSSGLNNGQGIFEHTLPTMRSIAAIAALLLLSTAALTFQRDLESLKMGVDRAKGGQKAKLASELTDYLVSVANQQFTQGNNAEAQATVQDVLKYAKIARDAGVESHDKLKQTEAGLQRAQQHLEELKRTLGTEDRPPLDAVEEQIKGFRKDLLDATSLKKKK